MSCEYCTDPDGQACFPLYGVGPHTHDVLGRTIPVPREQWPGNYREDKDCPGMGLYWCQHCGDGKPTEPIERKRDESQFIRARTDRWMSR